MLPILDLDPARSGPLTGGRNYPIGLLDSLHNANKSEAMTTMRNVPLSTIGRQCGMEIVPACV